MSTGQSWSGSVWGRGKCRATETQTEIKTKRQRHTDVENQRLWDRHKESESEFHYLSFWNEIVYSRSQFRDTDSETDTKNHRERAECGVRCCLCVIKAKRCRWMLLSTHRESHISLLDHRHPWLQHTRPSSECVCVCVDVYENKWDKVPSSIDGITEEELRLLSWVCVSGVCV